VDRSLQPMYVFHVFQSISSVEEANMQKGSAVKSPLIMGNDIRIIQPKAFSILSNPAVIAVNQDPLGSSAARRWLFDANGTDPRSRAVIQLWSGNLKSTTGGEYNDMVVLLINGNNDTAVMNATLADIFDDSGPGGSAPQVKLSWEVRDLWANRMGDEQAQAIINSTRSNSTTTLNSTMQMGRYNATRMSYAEGLASNNSLLLGNVTTTVQPSGTITATVDSHGAAMFRLRALPTAMVRRDEL
jgi:alpha-galactosidase